MAKARRMMNKNLKLVDMVVELLDARIPFSSTNPDFEALYKNKIRVVLLSKIDLADSVSTQKWITHFKEKDIKICAVNCLKSADIKKVSNLINSLAAQRQKEVKERRGINKTVRAMITGIPNVGKSTFINSLVGKGKTKTGDIPGVTRGGQWVKVGTYLEVLDTPGMLWPKIKREEDALHIAYTGAIRDEVLDIEEVAVLFLKEIAEKVPEALKTRYKIEDTNKEGYQLLDDICRKRGFIMKGGVLDTLRGANMVLDEYREGRLGRMTLELPEQN